MSRRNSQPEHLRVIVKMIKANPPASKAVLVVSEDGEEVWVPRSQLLNEGEDLVVSDGDAEIWVTPWFAKKQGLEES